MKRLHSTIMPSSGVCLPNKATGIVGCGCYILQLSRTVNSKW